MFSNNAPLELFRAAQWKLDPLLNWHTPKSKLHIQSKSETTSKEREARAISDGTYIVGQLLLNENAIVRRDMEKEVEVIICWKELYKFGWWNQYGDFKINNALYLSYLII